MKEFQSTTGGRHAYNTDFKNLQELALAMQEIFRECGSNFVISGCNVTVGDTISISEGYVYIGNRICKVSAASGLQSSNLYIVAKQKNGDSIPYADGNTDIQYIDYYAEAVNSSSINSSYIAYDTASKTFPNLATAFFNYYAVCKKASNQSIDNLTIQQTLIVLKQLLVPQGIQFDNSASTKMSVNGSDVVIHNGTYDLCFSNSGSVSIKRNNSTLLSFSNASGSGLVTFGSVTVQSDLRTKKLYIDGVDIEQKLTPLGTIQMWAGPVNKIPSNYMLCNGQAISCTTYAELYAILGTTFNTARDKNGYTQAAPSTGTFRLPDLRQRFIAGYDSADSEYNNIANTGGEKKHYLQQSEMPSHTHNVDDYYFIETYNTVKDGSVYGNYKLVDNNRLGSHNSDRDNNAIMYKTHPTDYCGGNLAHENRPPFYTLAYIIRVK